MHMTGYYSSNLVALSVIVAIFASYTALELAGRVSRKQGRSAGAWLIGGAISMGTGIWSMHFVGMLAFHLPITLAYDPALTSLSVLIAIVTSGAALFVVSRSAVSLRSLIVGAALMGIGIAAMHYSGMHAIRMTPAIEYRADLFIASIVIAIVASFAALWISFTLRDQSFGGAILRKLGSAVVMGLAITGMHYTGMAAAEFAPNSVCGAISSTGMTSSALAVLIGITTIGLLIVTLVVSALDAHFAARLTHSLQKTNEQLSELALYDSLTGLPNRLLLDDRMGQAAYRAERSGHSFALLFIDLDRFKTVNDSLGHEAGDSLLKESAQRLVACVRAMDTVARIGGDEFVVVLSGIGAPADAAMVSRKILDELSRPFFISGQEVDISGSIGISIYPQDCKDVSKLKIFADQAMYYAKRSGRNKYRFFAEVDNPSST